MKINAETKAGIERIQAALDNIQGRCTARTITAEEVATACENLTKSIPIPKKYMVGCTATIDLNAQDFPNAYRAIPYSTHFSAEYTTSHHWFVTHVFRERCYSSSHNTCLTLTDTAKEKLIESYRELYI